MAIDQEDKTSTQEPSATGEPRYLHVQVIDHSKGEEPSVNVRLPIGVAKWGMKMAASFSPEMKGLDLDWAAIAATVEVGTRGEIIHVEDEEKQQTVDVWVD